MLMAVKPRLQAAPGVSSAIEDEHPAAAQTERAAAAGEPVDGVQDPDAKDDQRQPDDPAHDRIEPVRQQRPEGEGREPEGDDDDAVTDGVERAEADRLDLLRAEPAVSDHGAAGDARAPRPPPRRPRPCPPARPAGCAGRRRHAVGLDLGRAAVPVLMGPAGAMLLRRAPPPAAPAAAVVLVMSVIAAMWSQSMPWRMPSSSPVTSTPIPARGGVDLGDELEHRSFPVGLGDANGSRAQGRYRKRLHLRQVALRLPILRAMKPPDRSPATGREPARSATWSGHPGPPACPRPAVDAAASGPRRGPVPDRRARDRLRARRALSGARSGTIPSTVYRTLDVLEELGVLSHSHGADGREEFHVLPESEHGHLYCHRCGAQWELAADDPAVVASVDAFAARRGFAVDVSHLTMIGRCAACQTAGRGAGDPAEPLAATR